MIVTIAGSAFTFLPNDSELGSINIQTIALDCQVGNGQFPIPDPAASLTPVTGRQFKVVQDFALISDGFIVDYDTNRGPFRVQSQVEYPISIQDANRLLDGFRVTRSRPSETDYARVIAFAALDIPSADTTWVLNSSTVTMPAKTYSGVGWSELSTDTVEFTGKTLFVHDKAAGGRCLHYHVLTTGHTCGLSISDVVAAQNGVTVFGPMAPLRQRTSVDLTNNVMGRDQTGRTSTLADGTSIAAHNADGARFESLQDFDATSQADLDVKTAAYLASNKDDYDSYTCTIGPLDGTAVGLMRVGDIMTVTSAAMGLSASTQRISHITYTVANGNAPGLWYAALELGAPVRRRARVKPDLPRVVVPPGTPGTIPPVLPTGSTSLGIQFLSDATSAWLIERYQGVNSVFGPGDNIVNHTGAGTFVAYIQDRNSSTGHATTPYEVEGRTWVTHTAPAGATHALFTTRVIAGMVTPTTGNAAYAAVEYWNIWNAPYNTGTGPVWTDLGSIIGTGILKPNSTGAGIGDNAPISIIIPVDASGQIQMALTFDPSQTQVNSATGSPAFTSRPRYPNFLHAYADSNDSIGVCDLDAYPPTGALYTLDFMALTPLSGTFVNEETVGTGDGMTTVFATAFPYRSGAVFDVTCNGIVEYDIVETDPDTGSFTFGTAPFTGEVIKVTYQVQ